MPNDKAIPTHEAQQHLAALIERVNQVGGPLFIGGSKHDRAVLLGAAEYQALLERVEDLEDSLDVLRARLEAEPTRPLEEFVQELGSVTPHPPTPLSHKGRGGGRRARGRDEDRERVPSVLLPSPLVGEGLGVRGREYRRSRR
jgi:PHD/YefM family antitoxin component YafN of YafNO toxin-antitoxin module